MRHPGNPRDACFLLSGERVVAEPLLLVATDPHPYQLGSSNIVQISESEVLILNGMEYESFIDPILENIEGERVMIEAAAGLEVLQMAEDAYEGEDHTAETHAREVYEQLGDKSTNDEIQSGADVATAVDLDAEGEHSHEREMISIKLNAQSDGYYVGYLHFDSEDELGR